MPKAGMKMLGKGVGEVGISIGTSSTVAGKSGKERHQGGMVGEGI